jgi:hypothetical protein
MKTTSKQRHELKVEYMATFLPFGPAPEEQIWIDIIDDCSELTEQIVYLRNALLRIRSTEPTLESFIATDALIATEYIVKGIK